MPVVVIRGRFQVHFHLMFLAENGAAWGINKKMLTNIVLHVTAGIVSSSMVNRCLLVC